MYLFPTWSHKDLLQALSFSASVFGAGNAVRRGKYTLGKACVRTAPAERLGMSFTSRHVKLRRRLGILRLYALLTTKQRRADYLESELKRRLQKLMKATTPILVAKAPLVSSVPIPLAQSDHRQIVA